MSPALYKKTMAAREKSIQSSKEKKLKLRQARAKMVSDLRRGIVTVGGTEYNKSRDGRKLVMRDKSKDTIVINGVPFEMDPRGNKLVRKTNNSSSSSTASSVPVTTTTRIPSTSVLAARNAATPSSGLSGSTPKQFSIDGVVYVRTRSGNLVRASLVKELQKRATHKVKVKKMTPARKPRPFCQFFTRFGICSKGPTCPINPQAPICRPFATLGWCEAGINCKDRHVWICPDFGTPAGCERKCGLAHVANGGIRVKKDSDEKRERDSGGANSSDHHMDSKRKRMDPSSSLAGWAKRTGRYMDGLGQDKNQEQDVNLNGSVKAKRIQYDENFVPLDFDDEEEKQVMMDQEQDQNERMEEFEQEEMDEEDEDDVSSDQVESEDEDEDEDDEDDDEDDEEMPEIEDEDDEDEDDAENEGLHEELQQFYDEQDRQDNDY
ncbi:hypothetical protein BGX31_009216 [Mortierella sp. GBA43]|nr:hypothetical protein BGX31_009216 [Mortierella sp. GBA43]